MRRELTDVDAPEGADATDAPGDQPADVTDGTTPIELGPGEQPPVSLDPGRDSAERNAASGGWDGANEQIENDFEAEQLRRAKAERERDEGDEAPPLT